MREKYSRDERTPQKQNRMRVHKDLGKEKYLICGGGGGGGGQEFLYSFVPSLSGDNHSILFNFFMT